MRKIGFLLFFWIVGISSAQGISFGFFTDVHYGTTSTSGNLYYQSSLIKLSQALDTFQRHSLQIAFYLGDLVNGYTATDSNKAFTDLDSINLRFALFTGKIYGIIGNHDLVSLTKSQFLRRTAYTVKQNYYSFDTGNYHFVILDGNYNSDSSDFTPTNATLANATIPAAEQQWLKTDLSAAGSKIVIVLLHYPLDSTLSSGNVLKNNNVIRHIFEAAGNVKAVFSGHYHSGGYTMINGIHYIILQAMVLNALPNNNFAEATISLFNDSLIVKGYVNQVSYRLKFLKSTGIMPAKIQKNETKSKHGFRIVAGQKNPGGSCLSLTGRRVETGWVGPQLLISVPKFDCVKNKAEGNMYLK